MLFERLPAVWHDALADLQAGKGLSIILEEMSNGHILRVLRRLGMEEEVEAWLSDFRDFVGEP
jgi:hypothetical protein